MRSIAIIALAAVMVMAFAACPTEADDSGGKTKTATLNFSELDSILDKQQSWGIVTEGSSAYEFLVKNALEILGAMNDAKGLAIEFAKNVKVTVNATVEAASGFNSAIPLIDLSGAGTLEIAPNAEIIMDISGGTAVNSAGAKIEVLGTIDAQDTAINSDADILVKGKAAAINGEVNGDLKVENNAVLTVKSGYNTTVNNLTVSGAGTVTVEGNLINTGVIYNYGTINNDGAFYNSSGTIYEIGSSSITNPPSDGNIFSVTAINSAEITVTAPAAEQTPPATAAVSGAGHFTCGTITWAPSDDPFESGKTYTATVVLSVESGYIFTPITTAKINNQRAVITNFSASSITISCSFYISSSAGLGGDIKLKVTDKNSSSGTPSTITALCYTSDTSNYNPLTYDSIPIDLSSLGSDGFRYCIVNVPANIRLCFKYSGGYTDLITTWSDWPVKITVYLTGGSYKLEEGHLGL